MTSVALKNKTKRDLRLYYLSISDKLALKYKYEELKERLYNVSGMDNTTIYGTCNDDKNLNLIIELEELKDKLDEIERNNKAIELALDQLDETDRDIILSLWGERISPYDLAETYNYSVRSIYNHAYKALDDIILSMYGKK
ncbi:MAG: hypothetical protein SPI59_03205 [Finegoldia sp.]|nr:hypothetical protein [Finegoldia sp.]